MLRHKDDPEVKAVLARRGEAILKAQEWVEKAVAAGNHEDAARWLGVLQELRTTPWMGPKTEEDK